MSKIIKVVLAFELVYIWGFKQIYMHVLFILTIVPLAS